VTDLIKSVTVQTASERGKVSIAKAPAIRHASPS